MDSSKAAPQAGLRRLEALSVTRDTSSPKIRIVADEVPVALVYNGHSQAVMMATPKDLEDFAVGFSLTEQFIQSPAEIGDIDLVPTEKGVRVELKVPEAVVTRMIEARNRSLVGNTGCGLCGVDTLEQVEKPLEAVGAGATVDFLRIQAALSALSDRQLLNAEAHAVHAAAFADFKGKLRLVREDVGRHNALDKLIGALGRAGTTVNDGFCVITSRCSYEMVQKAAVAGFQILVAISAPTAPAVHIARNTGMTLIALARPDSMLVFNDRGRLRSVTIEDGSRDARLEIREVL
jgi:FdhD protein